MKRILSVLLATTLAATGIVPSFAVTYERNESFENAYAVSDRCDDFYKKSNNNYVVENGFLFDLDTQTIVQFDKNIYLENLMDKMLDGTTPEFASLRDIEKANTVIIPEAIAGKTVRFIGNHSFEDAGLTQVVIPSCVEKIGDYAFWGNRLTNVVLNEGLLEIGRYVFDAMSDAQPIVIPSSVKYIDTQQAGRYILKNPETKVNDLGYAAEYEEIVKKEEYTINPSAPLATEKYGEEGIELTDKAFWCLHTENNGFTYGYNLSRGFTCALCGGSFDSYSGACPYCHELIKEEDGTCLRHLSEAEQHRLFEEKHNGMDLREYVIDRLKTAGLITDEYTALTTDEEVNTYLESSIPENTYSGLLTGTVPIFLWKDGKIETNLIRTIISYNSSVDETPEEITFSSKDERIASTDIFNNLDKVQTLSLNAINIMDWAMENRSFDISFSEDKDVGESAVVIALDYLYSWGNCKLFTGCDNINTVNLLDSTDYSGMTEEDIVLEKAMGTDCIALFLKRMLNANFENLALPDGYEYVDGVVYANNGTQLVAVVKDMETYEMPSTVTTVNNFALSEITIKNVIWGENCKYIPVACFIRSNIQNIDFKNVTEIRDLAFYETNIKTLSLPETLITLGNMIFAKSQLESIDLPKSLKQSGYSLFSGCLNLRSIVLENATVPGVQKYDMLFGVAANINANALSGLSFSLKTYSETVKKLDSSLFGFVPNLSNLHFGVDATLISLSTGGTVNPCDTENLGYMPSLTNITIDENNPDFYVYKGFLLEGDRVILAPNGMNFYNGNEIPLWLFTPEGFSIEYGDIDLPSAYYKPINSVVASTSDCCVVGMDINHLYIDDNEKMSEMPYYMSGEFWWFLFAPNYFHTNADLSALIVRNQIPDTVTIVNEARKVSVSTEDNAKTEVTLHNITGKIYKIPFYTELAREDVFNIGDYCEYSGKEEYISVSPDILENKPLVFGFAIDNIVKALRINGDMDLQTNNCLQIMSEYLSCSEVYNLELTPNSAKSMFKDNAQMQVQIDKYTWDDGFLHFKEGFKYPILQCENPTDEIILDFVYNFLLPWKATVEGKSPELTFKESEMEELMQLNLSEKLTVVDKDGFEIEDIVYENFYFEYWIMMNYDNAKEFSADFLNQSNITTYSEFKDWYIDTLVFFDEETRTFEGMIGVRDSSYAGAFSGFSQLYPSHINGIPVEHISISPCILEGGGSYIYIPSAVKDIGYISPNSLKCQKGMMAYAMLGEKDGMYLSREEVAELSKKVKIQTFSLSYAPDSNTTLLNCFGLYSTPERIYISPHNKSFKKLTSPAGIQILSKDERVCYLATTLPTSSQTSTYAPLSLVLGAFDVLCNPAEFQTVSYMIGMNYEGLGCSNCYIVLNDGENVCPLCGSTELTEINENMTMKTTCGATWMQTDDEEKQCATILYASEDSPFAEHCKKEHYHANADEACHLETGEGIEDRWSTEAQEVYYNTIAAALSENTPKAPDTYSLTTDLEDLNYANGQIFEKQILKIDVPDKYLDPGYIIVEPFQMTEEINLELKKGTVNLSVYNLDDEEYYTGETGFDVYNTSDNTLFTTINTTNDSASSVIPYGEYYIVPHAIDGYDFEVERLPLSITEDGQIINLSFNISLHPSYTLNMSEFLQATKTGETSINNEVSLTDIVLPKTKSLNVTVAYSGKLKNTYQESNTLSYVLYSSDGTAIASNDSVLDASYGTDRVSVPIYAQITDEVLYAGVYTDTAIFTVEVI